MCAEQFYIETLNAGQVGSRAERMGLQGSPHLYLFHFSWSKHQITSPKPGLSLLRI